MNRIEVEPAKPESDLCFVGFALSDCTAIVDRDAARYLRAVPRTALELAVASRYGLEVGGFWSLQEQIDQLRLLPEFYPPNEAPHVMRAVEAFLGAQLESSLLMKGL
jgi:hypothetical protein